MNGKTVLIVDDDEHVRNITETVFKRNGAQVLTAAGGSEGLRQFFARKPDLVILDIMMPEVDGFEVCQRIRQVSNAPVILLTALNSAEEIIHGLECGADDFVTKPFKSDVLIARVKAVLRRVGMPQETEPRQLYSDDYLTIDLGKRLITTAGSPVRLTRTEYNLLAYLMQNAGWVRTFEQILENVWGYEYQDSLDYVHVYISHLRKKIEPDPKNPEYLQTEHGVGYRFVRKISPA